MAGILYFIPNANTGDIGEPSSLPFAYAFEKKSKLSKVQSGTGPDGKSGVIVANPGSVKAPQMRYVADKQTWCNCGEYYCGVWNDAIPSPEDLARKEQLPGEYLELADEREWLIPIARRWSINESSQAMEWETDIPRTIEIRGQSIFHGPVIKRYQALWTIANAIYNTRDDGETADELVSLEAERDLMGGFYPRAMCAAMIIQENYRVGPVECTTLLRLLDTSTANRIFDVLTNWNSYRHMKKKIAELASGQHSCNGQEGSSSTTDQPSSIATA